jgi:hypothetical protein
MLRGGLIFPIFLIVILGALDLKRALSLSLTLSHKWEREQILRCSLCVSGAKICSVPRYRCLSHKWEKEQTQACSALFAVQSSVPCVTSPSQLPS